MSVDLTTRYLGLTLGCPIVAAASPLTATVENAQRLEEAGAGAIVLPSLFEEQIEGEALDMFDAPAGLLDAPPFESATLCSELDDYNTGPDFYLRKVEAIKRSVSIPVIASLNGAATGDWVRFAALMQGAGADAIEVNIFVVPVSPHVSGHDVEQRYLNVVRAVRKQITIPLAIKTGPFFSALPHFAQGVFEAGADGLVAFNRYLAPDIDLEHLSVAPSIHLSTRSELAQTLRWIGILRDQTDRSLAALTGIHEAEDVLKALAVGADVVMTCSALLQGGIGRLTVMRNGVRDWLEMRGYDSVDQFRGCISRRASGEADAFVRGNYTKAVASYLQPPT